MTKARDLANIISGGFDATDIPNLDTAKITSGTFVDARLPATALNSNVDLTTLSASNLTSGTVPTARLGSGTASSSTFLRGDNTFAEAGGANTPSFVAYVGSNQSISNATNTKVNYTTEHFDTDSAYDTTNKRFTVPSGQAGKYFISAGYNANTDTTTKLYILISVNGSFTFSSMLLENIKYRDNDSFINVDRILDLSVGDYVEIYVRQEQGSTATLQSNGSWFQGYKLI